MTPGEWDTRWWVIYNDARSSADVDTACEIADDETAEQFGPRPEEINR